MLERISDLSMGLGPIVRERVRLEIEDGISRLLQEMQNNNWIDIYLHESDYKWDISK